MPILDDVLLFFKLYDPKNKLTTYCCCEHLKVNLPARDLIPILNKRAGYPENTPLELYEVCGFND